MSQMPSDELIVACEDFPVVDLLSTNDVHVESFFKDAMVPALSDRGLVIPVVFEQAEITYAESPQNRYDDKVQQKLHDEKNKSKLYGATEIQTLVSIFKVPDRCTDENIRMKKKLLSCNKKNLFRTKFIQSYINEDWQNFAQWFAYGQFVLYLSFAALIMIQFW